MDLIADETVYKSPFQFPLQTSVSRLEPCSHDAPSAFVIDRRIRKISRLCASQSPFRYHHISLMRPLEMTPISMESAGLKVQSTVKRLEPHIKSFSYFDLSS